MVPNGTSYANYPSFANNGTKTPPGGSPESAKYALGMVPADTFPAEWANWLFHGATAGITRLNADVGSIKKELNSILLAYNITNDASAYNQLLACLEKIYPQITTCSTAAATQEKTLAIEGNVLKAGNVYVVEMTNGNTYGDGSTTYPTMSINSGTAYPICDASGSYAKSGAWSAGETIKVLFTGSRFLMSTQSVVNIVQSNDMHPVTSNATRGAIDSAIATEVINRNNAISTSITNALKTMKVVECGKIDNNKGFYIKYESGLMEQWNYRTFGNTTLQGTPLYKANLYTAFSIPYKAGSVPMQIDAYVPGIYGATPVVWFSTSNVSTTDSNGTTLSVISDYPYNLNGVGYYIHSVGFWA